MHLADLLIHVNETLGAPEQAALEEVPRKPKELLHPVSAEKHPIYSLSPTFRKSSTRPTCSIELKTVATVVNWWECEGGRCHEA